MAKKAIVAHYHPGMKLADMVSSFESVGIENNNKNKEVECIDLTVLNLSTFDLEVKLDIIEAWLSGNGVKFKQTASQQYKILNGCVPNIMVYPSTSKIMVQDNGKNHIITTTAKNILAIIQGDLAFK